MLWSETTGEKLFEYILETAHNFININIHKVVTTFEFWINGDLRSSYIQLKHTAAEVFFSNSYDIVRK